ncbi:MAG TPA: DNA repair protein RecO [Clostridiales bacterium]|nr:DNA repair protein RecO [Clostridiales bacterium]
MPATYRLEAVVLRCRDLGETDRLVTLYSREHGKQQAVARGVRRAASRRAGSLQPFAHLRCLVARGRTLDVIAQVELLNSFAKLRDDLTLLTWAGHILELVDAAAGEGDRGASFPLLLAALHLLAGGADPELTARAFELRHLSAAGLEPELTICCRCGGPLGDQGELRFNPAEGGAICAACGKTSGDRLLRRGILATMLYLKDADLRQVDRLVVSARDRAELEALLRAYLEFHLDRPLRSLAFLDTLREQEH